MDWMDLAGEMPLEQIVQALDDNRDGEVDEAAWERVQAGAAERLRDCFGGPPPAKFNQTCGYAQKVFMLEALYVRRGFYGKENPYAQKAADAERRLRALAGGEESVDAGSATGFVVDQPLSGTPVHGFLA